MIAVSIEHAEWYPVPIIHPTGDHLVGLDADVIERYNAASAAFTAALAEIRQAEEAQERLIYGGRTWREHNAEIHRRFYADQAEAKRRDRQQRQWG